MFERDLLFVREHCTPISFEQLASKDTPRGSVLFTFDDGYRECFSVARPLLKKYEIPCMFFVTASFIDNQRIFYRHKVSLCIEEIAALPHQQIAQ